MDLNLTDYKILANILSMSKNDKGISKFKSVTIKDIKENVELSEVTIRKSTEKLVQTELISPGIRRGKSKTYYINKKGVQELKEISKSEVIVNE